ncbi:hypothetical protein DFH94DRAFT_680995 [Russula ochroleuca]|uniref:Secreted protein n=1 Tax=Russula ochroleuca TaxID=152965 RepID=A0A9P5TAI9_9AGAM|nr:hypothetical protein DFH94DRAFT_680995 [Russula ochroleuca]
MPCFTSPLFLLTLVPLSFSFPLSRARLTTGKASATEASVTDRLCPYKRVACIQPPDTVPDLQASRNGWLGWFGRPAPRQRGGNDRRGDVPDLTVDPTLAEKELGPGPGRSQAHTMRHISPDAMRHIRVEQLI